MSALLNYISDPRSAEYCFSLALWYDEQGHTAAAAGFYVRTAEYSENVLLSYEALLRLSSCFMRQGSRVHLNKGILLRAISLLPQRPEAYFLLSRLYEVNKDWEESYSFAVMGQALSEEQPKLRTNVEYPGRYALIFEQAVSAWWIGLFDESIHLFRQLKKDPAMLPIHAAAVQNNLRNLEGTVWHNTLAYSSSLYERLRVKFPGAKSIIHNYSQAYQDIFVLTMLGGKTDGSFLEIGCGDPSFRSNTKLLEEFGWSGISIDSNQTLTSKYAEQRKNRVITADASRLDYAALLEKDYDYLQIDTEPALNSFNVLLRIPFEKRRFAVITFEHDDYCYPSIKERSRKYLQSHGYTLIAGDIAPDSYNSFEDWWAHPALVAPQVIEKMRDTREVVKKADGYMLL